jgi:F-type H+-transporting ATPase subunit delta
MTSSAIASRYAGALVDVVTAHSAKDDPQAIIGQLRDFQAAMESSPGLRNAMNSPAISPARKRAVVGRLADAMQASRIVRNFLFILVDNGRVGALPGIVDTFETLLGERLGYARVDVTSAAGLDEPQRQALTSQLERLTGKRVKPRFAVDAELIGGVVARAGSTVYDGSVRGRLQALGRRLTAE